jgi:hypothetical protein
MTLHICAQKVVLCSVVGLGLPVVVGPVTHMGQRLFSATTLFEIYTSLGGANGRGQGLPLWGLACALLWNLRTHVHIYASSE